MKKLLFILFTFSSFAINAEETANILADQVIHNYKSVPMKVSGRHPKGEICLWNHKKKVWSCSKTDTIPTGGIAVLRNANKPTLVPGRPPTYYRSWINPRGSTLKKTQLFLGQGDQPKPGTRGYGHVIVTDVGEVAIKSF